MRIAIDDVRVHHESTPDNLPGNFYKIPEDLLAKAEGVAVIPNVMKGAFIAGGRFGKGVVADRGENGTWGRPSFVDLGGASFGLQVGVEASDLDPRVHGA